MRPIPGRNGFIGAYEIREFFRTGYAVILPQKELLVIRGMFTDEQRCEMLDGLRILATPDGVTEIPQRISEETFVKLARYYNDQATARFFSIKGLHPRQKNVTRLERVYNDAYLAFKKSRAVSLPN